MRARSRPSAGVRNFVVNWLLEIGGQAARSARLIAATKRDADLKVKNKKKKSKMKVDPSKVFTYSNKAHSVKS